VYELETQDFVLVVATWNFEVLFDTNIVEALEFRLAV